MLQCVAECCSVLQCRAMINVPSSWTMGNPYESKCEELFFLFSIDPDRMCMRVRVSVHMCVCVCDCVCVCVCVCVRMFVCVCVSVLFLKDLKECV